MRQHLIPFSKRLSKTFLDLLLPPRCPITGKLVEQQGTLDPQYWSTLNFIQAPLCNSCGTPFEHHISGEMICASCLQDPPEFQAARHVWHYDDASAAMILKLKHADALHLAPVLGKFLVRAGEEILRDADLLIPVPLHRRRLLKRRYNQASLLAKTVSRETGIPMAPHLLRRSRATESQGRKSTAERRQNIRQAFHILPSDTAMLSGKRIVLIDDVYTSGATVKECTNVLLKNGAAYVSVLCLAKVVKN